MLFPPNTFVTFPNSLSDTVILFLEVNFMDNNGGCCLLNIVGFVLTIFLIIFVGLYLLFTGQLQDYLNQW
jgi:hypothetical protein